MKFLVTGGLVIGEQANKQLSREPLPTTRLWLNPNIGNLTKFTIMDM